MKRIRDIIKVRHLTIKHSAKTRESFSFLLLVAGILLLPVSRLLSALNLMRSHRNSSRIQRKLLIEKMLNFRHLLDPDVSDRLIPDFDPVLKKVSPQWMFKLKEHTTTEKGVLLIKFNDTFEKLRAEFDIARLLADYHIVLEPSCSGYCIPEILQFTRYRDSSIIVLASEPMDFDFLKRLNSNLIPIEIGSSDWINDKVFTDMALERKFDCVMVAMWNQVKRHQALLKVVAEIADPTFRVALAGAPWDMTVQDIRDLIAFYGIERNVEIFEGYRHPQINILYNQSKVQVLMSLREGSNNATCEGFFANLPGIVLKNNMGVNKNYINDRTGRLIEEKDLKDTLLYFRENYSNFRPRKWALENISCPVSTAKLEKKLKEIAFGRGERWETPIAVRVNNGSYPAYYEDGVELTPFEADKYCRGDISARPN